MLQSSRGTDLTPEVIAAAAAEILAGRVVAYPTETFYALGADPRQPRALREVLRLKGGGRTKPLLLLFDSLPMVAGWVMEVPQALDVIASRHWPGPLTVVLRAAEHLSEEITAGTNSIGVRLTPHPVARALVRHCGVPLTGTSANRTNQTPPTCAAAIRTAFGDELKTILDGGETAGGPPSTLLDLTVKPWQILRQGAVAADEIAETLRLV